MGFFYTKMIYSEYMNLIFIGYCCTFIGKILVAITAVMVHHRVLHEHKIDREVFATMQREQKWGILGIIFLVVGFILEAPLAWGS